jgi:multidrug efflux pump subunit AcrA (membrane-fusion protein)
MLPGLPVSAVIPNAAIRNVGGELGVWKIEGGNILFTTVELGASDLDGLVQVTAGLEVGDEVVVYSASRLVDASRIRIVADPGELLK